jgi:hypothetical protein
MSPYNQTSLPTMPQQAMEFVRARKLLREALQRFERAPTRANYQQVAAAALSVLHAREAMQGNR